MEGDTWWEGEEEVFVAKQAFVVQQFEHRGRSVSLTEEQRKQIFDFKVHTMDAYRHSYYTLDTPLTHPNHTLDTP